MTFEEMLARKQALHEVVLVLISELGSGGVASALERVRRLYDETHSEQVALTRREAANAAR